MDEASELAALSKANQGCRRQAGFRSRLPSPAGTGPLAVGKGQQLGPASALSRNMGAEAMKAAKLEPSTLGIPTAGFCQLCPLLRRGAGAQRVALPLQEAVASCLRPFGAQPAAEADPWPVPGPGAAARRAAAPASCIAGRHFRRGATKADSQQPALAPPGPCRQMLVSGAEEDQAVPIGSADNRSAQRTHRNQLR